MSMSLRDRIRKRREDDDDDMMLFIFPALYLTDSAGGGEKKKRHTSEETGEVKVHRLLEGHVKNCQVTFRMEPYIFNELATYLRSKRIIVDTRIKVEEKLGFFLYMLSHNASYEDLQVFFGHSNDTFHHHINHFFKKVIPKLPGVSFNLLILIKCIRKSKTTLDSIHSSRIVSVPLMELTFLFP